MFLTVHTTMYSILQCNVSKDHTGSELILLVLFPIKYILGGPAMLVCDCLSFVVYGPQSQ